MSSLWTVLFSRSQSDFFCNNFRLLQFVFSSFSPPTRVRFRLKRKQYNLRALPSLHDDHYRRYRRRSNGRADNEGDWREIQRRSFSNWSHVCCQEVWFSQSDDYAMSAQDPEPSAQEAAGGYRLRRPRVHRIRGQQKKWV